MRIAQTRGGRPPSTGLSLAGVDLVPLATRGEAMNSDVPQFATAEYPSKAAETICRACGQKISGAHYRVNGVAACTGCTQRLRDQLPQDSPQAFARAILFGSGAAVLGFG